MDDHLRQLLKIPYNRLDAINALLLDPDMRSSTSFFRSLKNMAPLKKLTAKQPRLPSSQRYWNKLKK